MQAKENIITEWFYWQFYEMPAFLFEVWTNYFNFATNIFSTSLLLKTFFAPWRKYNWRYPKIDYLLLFINTLISYILSLFLGEL